MRLIGEIGLAGIGVVLLDGFNAYFLELGADKELGVVVETLVVDRDLAFANSEVAAKGNLGKIGLMAIDCKNTFVGIIVELPKRGGEFPKGAAFAVGTNPNPRFFGITCLIGRTCAGATEFDHGISLAVNRNGETAWFGSNFGKFKINTKWINKTGWIRNIALMLSGRWRNISAGIASIFVFECDNY